MQRIEWLKAERLQLMRPLNLRLFDEHKLTGIARQQPEWEFFS
jgi:hypothetical protein